MSRSLNKAELIGNLTRDPELRYTPSGAAVCTFGLATNRNWTTDTGEKKEDVEFHRIVAWNKLAELCAQLLQKGRKVYVEGRLQTRKWTGQDGQERTTTEIVINDMIILDSRGATAPGEEFDVPEDLTAEIPLADETGTASQTTAKTSSAAAAKADDKTDSSGKNAPAATSTKKPAAEKTADEGDDIPF
jgi:single-strand DNA-binding protein